MPTRRQIRYKQIVDDWVLNHGYVCPGYRRAAHKAHERYNRLTVDHIIPRRRGGSEDRRNLRVLCRKCNSSKRDRPDTTITKGPSFPHPLL